MLQKPDSGRAVPPAGLHLCPDAGSRLLVSFPILWQILELNNLQRKRGLFGWSGRFPSTVSWPCCFGACGEAVTSEMRAEPSGSSPGSERGKRKGLGSCYHVTQDLLLGPASWSSHHLCCRTVSLEIKICNPSGKLFKQEGKQLITASGSPWNWLGPLGPSPP